MPSMVFWLFCSSKSQSTYPVIDRIYNNGNYWYISLQPASFMVKWVLWLGVALWERYHIVHRHSMRIDIDIDIMDR